VQGEILEHLQTHPASPPTLQKRELRLSMLASTHAQVHSCGAAGQEPDSSSSALTRSPG